MTSGLIFDHSFQGSRPLSAIFVPTEVVEDYQPNLFEIQRAKNFERTYAYNELIADEAELPHWVPKEGKEYQGDLLDFDEGFEPGEDDWEVLLEPQLFTDRPWMVRFQHFLLFFFFLSSYLLSLCRSARGKSF